MAAQVYFTPFIPTFNGNGLPVGSAKLYFYYTGTNNPAPIYSDSGMTTPMDNPVEADLAGRYDNVYLDDSITYRVRCTTADGTPVGADIDNYIPGTAYTIVPSLPQLINPAGAGLVGFTQSGTDAIDSTVQTELRRVVWAERFGLSTTNTAAQNSAAIMAAVVALRSNPVGPISDGLNGTITTAYASGELCIGVGEFKIAPDVIRITQDLGLVIKGRGSRKTNNSVKGRTILMIEGNGQYGIQFYGNGARGCVLEDIDLTYYDNTFTGDVLDNFGAPGCVINRCHLGTNGVTGGTRFQTARSIVRATYDEFMHFIDTTFDGAIDGFWSDDTRQPPTGPTNEFGGSGTSFSSCVFYDFTGAMIKASGARNRKKFAVRDCTFNPIQVDCTRGLDINNIDALTLNIYCTPSTGKIATSGWLRIVNCTGGLTNSQFLGPCAIGSISGNIKVDNNFFGCDSGVVLAGGVITGSGNEFSQGAVATPSGFIVTPTIPLTFHLGPDTFKSGMGYSYDIAADSANLDGHVVYSASQDASTNRFRNASARVCFDSNDRKGFSVSATTYTVLPTDTSRTINLTSGTGCTVTLPAVSTTLGCTFRLLSNTTQVIIIQGPAGTLYVGGGAAKTSMTSGAGDAGMYVEIQNRVGAYNVVNRIGNFTYA